MDGEFYAEGVLKVYSFPGKIVVYLRGRAIIKEV